MVVMDADKGTVIATVDIGRGSDGCGFDPAKGLAYSSGVMHLGGDSYTDGVDVDKECYPAGQGVGGITELVPAGELVRRFVAEAEAALDRLPALR